LGRVNLIYFVKDPLNVFGRWPDDVSDVRQLRPTEIVFEEWKKLRDEGIQTPQLVVWNRLEGPNNLYLEYLDRIYNNPEYTDMILKQKETGLMVFFVRWAWQTVNDTSIRTLAENGGRNNIAVVRDWFSNAGIKIFFFSFSHF